MESTIQKQNESILSNEQKQQLRERALSSAKDYYDTHKQFLQVAPNIPYVVKLSKDWYITPDVDPEHWITKSETRPIKDQDTGKERDVSSTIFRVQQLSPLTNQDGFLQELSLSKNAFDVFEPLLKEKSFANPDNDLIITFKKIQLGTKFQIKWEFQVDLA